MRLPCYQNLFAPEWRLDFDKIIAKCCELAQNRPPPEDRHGGFFGMGGFGDHRRLHLLTVWAITPGEPDIFILGGDYDGFGPGHTCPTKEELRQGIYGELIPVALL